MLNGDTQLISNCSFLVLPHSSAMSLFTNVELDAKKMCFHLFVYSCTDLGDSIGID